MIWPAFLQDTIPAAVLDSVAITLPEGVIVALISAGASIGTWLLTRRAQVRDMAVRVEKEAEAIAAARREEAEAREEERREKERDELVKARAEEVRLTRELRDELRKELANLRTRVKLLEGELEDARQERQKHGEERLEWFGERDELRRQLATAHEEIAELQECVRGWENLFQREELKAYVEEHGPIRVRQQPREAAGAPDDECPEPETGGA